MPVGNGDEKALKRKRVKVIHCPRGDGNVCNRGAKHGKERELTHAKNDQWGLRVHPGVKVLDACKCEVRGNHVGNWPCANLKGIIRSWGDHKASARGGGGLTEEGLLGCQYGSTRRGK